MGSLIEEGSLTGLSRGSESETHLNHKLDNGRRVFHSLPVSIPFYNDEDVHESEKN